MKKVIFTLKLPTGVETVGIDILEGEGLAIVGLDECKKGEILKNIAQKGKGVTYRGIVGGLQKSEQDLFDLEIGYVEVNGSLKKKRVSDVIEKASVFYDMLNSEIGEVVDLPSRYFSSKIGELPKFMQDRLALLDTISEGHSVILIDDSFGFDGLVKTNIIEFLVKASKKPLTYIVATSDFELANICAKTVIVDDGRVVEWGKTNKVLKSPVHPFSKWFVELSRKGKTSVSWRKGNGRLKRRACRYALVCPEASAECLKECAPFAPYSKTEYVPCRLGQIKSDSIKSDT